MWPVSSRTENIRVPPIHFRLEGKVIFFATNNVHKFQEARLVLRKHLISVGMLRVKALEIQSDDLSEIAAASVREAYARCHLPLIVEDAGLFVNALNGFPGPYAAYAFKTLGNRGLLSLMEDVADRKATFRSAVAFLSESCKEPECFEGEVSGEITREERIGREMSGFGFDPIFKPSRGCKTFAEMSLEQKNEYSHRAQALRRFAEWYKNGSR